MVPLRASARPQDRAIRAQCQRGTMFVNKAMTRAALLAVALGALAATETRAETVKFVCLAPAGHTCQYQVRTAQGPLNFSLPSGQKREVSGVTPRADKYCVCDPGPVSPDCTAPQVGSWCLGYWADVVPGENS
jgi:hypothetical protein